MSFIDLHTHSTASDGTFSPSEVVKKAKEQGLSAIALTDHDTVAGVKEAVNCGKEIEMSVIPGIELSCHALGKEIHIVGLFVDYEDPDFLAKLEALRDNRTQRNMRMLEAFQRDGFPITLEKLQRNDPNSVITRAHFARVLKEEGIVPSMDVAFKKYLGDGKKYYIPRLKIEATDGIRCIKEAGGIAILAHPYEYQLSKEQLLHLVEILINAGIDGIECYHSNNYLQQSTYLRELTKKYHLLATGGSDFHGTNKLDVQLGIGRGGLRIHESLLNEIQEFRKKR